MTDLKDKIVTEIKKIYDPEIPVNIYELGLIYKIDVKDAKKVTIEMTLTSPNFFFTDASFSSAMRLLLVLPC